MILNQITLPVKDMETAVDFYLKLGFTQIVDSPHYARFETLPSGPTLSLSLQDEDFSNGAVIYFEEENLDQRVSELQKEGIPFQQLPTEMRYLWKEAILKDPSGNKIKLYWAGENRLNPPWRVDIKK